MEQYLDQHNIVKSCSNQSTLLTRLPSKNAKIKRKMSVKGAIKKTRSFMLDGNILSEINVLNLFYHDLCI